LYEAAGFEHWSFPLTSDWTHLHGMLLNNGTNRGSVSAPIFAPYRPEVANYAVEAAIRVIEAGDSFGVVVRVDDDGRGYAAGIGRKGGMPFAGMLSGFEAGQDWHTYRIEARGNVFTQYIDGTFHIPPNLVVECIPTHRKPPEVRICRLSIQSAVGTRPPSTSTPHCPACLARC